MSSGGGFLSGLAQALATMSLYHEGHPARERAIDHAYEALADLQEEHPTPVFTFLGEEIVMGTRPLRELRSWDWGGRLAEAGIQRLEFVEKVSREDFVAFLDETWARLGGRPVSSAEARQERPTNIRYGLVGIQGEADGRDAIVEAGPTATFGYSLREEIEGIEWLHGELKDQRQLHLLEAEAIVRSLSVAMHGDQAFLMPLLRLKEFDQYTTTHALNVSVLTMSLAESLGMSPKEVRTFGIAGLLHDLGKVKVPMEILNKPGKLTDEERVVMNSHTVEGARIILETEEHLDLAAVVAYEHHIRIDGGGYPALKYARACHSASKLVHVCDVFDALRTDRPYRKAWPTDRALEIIEEGAGPEFDENLARAFVQMMKRWEGRLREVSITEPEITTLETPPAEAAAEAAADMVVDAAADPPPDPPTGDPPTTGQDPPS